MAERDINCRRCTQYMGTIRDAKLRKDIVYMCDKCHTALLALEMKSKIDDANPNRGFDTDGMFGDVFGDIFGNSKYKK